MPDSIKKIITSNRLANGSKIDQTCWWHI